MPTYGFDHIHLIGPDPEATAGFYERVFGMRRLQTFEIGGRPSVRLAAGGARITITQRTPAASGRGNAIDHFALFVDDFDAAEADLRAKDVLVVTERAVSGIHDTLFVQAPDGVIVEIMSPATG